MNPPLRFSATEDWIECQLKDICEINPSAGKIPDEFQYIDLESVTNGRLLQTIPCCKSSAPSRAKRILSNEDVLFQTVRPYQKNNYFFKSDSNTSVVASTGYAQLRCTSNSAYFLYTLIHTDSFVNQVLQKCTGGAYPAITASSLSTVKINIPVVQEQQKIASFFSTLDQKIELNERKLEALEKLKKELMHQIFNRKIRFKEKDGTEFPEWASSTLGNEVQFAKGGKLGKKDLRENGAFPCLLYGELYTFYKCIASTIISRTNISSDNHSKKNDVVIPTSGETAEDIATATCIPHDGVLYGGDLLILRSKSLYGPFLSYLINSSLKRKISRLAQGKSVVHIGADKIKTIEFQFPCTKEQQKIANFLSSFDQKIDVIEKRIEAMRKLKFGFMQQMFV